MSSGPGRVLVVGASGLVGTHLVRAARARGLEVTGAARNPTGEATLKVDLLDRASLDAALSAVQPELVALCSAWPWVDGCEKDPARSHRENVDTVANAVAATRGSKTSLLWFSSDHVFDGSLPRHGEADAPHPLSVYARHKREAEDLLLARGEVLVARTAWVFGAEKAKKNFLYRVVDAARANTPLEVPREQSGCPTWAGWLADSALILLAQGQRGLLHLSGPELLSKAAWARKLAAQLGLPNFEVREVEWVQAGQVAPRPASVCLKSVRHALVQAPLDDLLLVHRESLLNP
jgi:dTDP-4-dehydrorhamnose reductase